MTYKFIFVVILLFQALVYAEGNNSLVEVVATSPQGKPMIKVSVNDPDKIASVSLSNKHDQIPFGLVGNNCDVQLEEVFIITNYPKKWFPATIEVKDCQGNIQKFGPFKRRDLAKSP